MHSTGAVMILWDVVFDEDVASLAGFEAGAGAKIIAIFVWSAMGYGIGHLTKDDGRGRVAIQINKTGNVTH